MMAAHISGTFTVIRMQSIRLRDHRLAGANIQAGRRKASRGHRLDSTPDPQSLAAIRR